MIIILITIITILLFILSTRESFGNDKKELSKNTQEFLKNTLIDRTIISDVLSDENFVFLMNNVPGQTVFNISGTPPVVSKTITQVNPEKIKDLPFSKLIGLCDKIISAINNYILTAKNTNGVYTKERLDAFLIYYENMVNNIIIIKNYILPLK